MSLILAGSILLDSTFKVLYMAPPKEFIQGGNTRNGQEVLWAGINGWREGELKSDPGRGWGTLFLEDCRGRFGKKGGLEGVAEWKGYWKGGVLCRFEAGDRDWVIGGIVREQFCGFGANGAALAERGWGEEVTVAAAVAGAKTEAVVERGNWASSKWSELSLVRQGSSWTWDDSANIWHWLSCWCLWGGEHNVWMEGEHMAVTQERHVQ
jgi:hypothetical protein